MKQKLRLLKRHIRFSYFKLVLIMYRSILFTISGFDERYIIESVRRKQWFYRSKFPVFKQKHFLADIPELTGNDRIIASEVQTYWRSLVNTTPPDQTIWSLDLHNAHDLIGPLDGNSVEHLAEVLNGMFHSSYIQGISHGFRHKDFPSSRLLVPIVTEDRLVSLAEYLGVVPAETSEQGTCGIAMNHGLEKIVEKIERTLGFSISFPDNFGASGIQVGSRIITKRHVEHIYTACRIRASFEELKHTENNITVTEIGGGYGGLCMWMLKAFKNIEKYYIVDLPWVNTFQAYFLKKYLGKDSVAFWNDDLKRKKLAKVIICSSEDYRSYMDTVRQSDIYLNQDSLPEMPTYVSKNYLEWIFSKKGSLFFSYQQENGINIKESNQNNVHEFIKSIESAKLKHRNLSWTRDGYTEETYDIL